jgi:hypothetical protein
MFLANACIADKEKKKLFENLVYYKRYGTSFIMENNNNNNNNNEINVSNLNNVIFVIIHLQ